MLTLNSEKYFLSSENISSYLKTFPLIHYPETFSLTRKYFLSYLTENIRFPSQSTS